MIKRIFQGRTDVSPVGLGVWVNVISLLCLPLYFRACARLAPGTPINLFLPFVFMVAMPLVLCLFVRRPYPLFARGLKFGALSLGVLTTIGMTILFLVLRDI